LWFSLLLFSGLYVYASPTASSSVSFSGTFSATYHSQPEGCAQDQHSVCNDSFSGSGSFSPPVGSASISGQASLDFSSSEEHSCASVSGSATISSASGNIVLSITGTQCKHNGGGDDEGNGNNDDDNDNGGSTFSGTFGVTGGTGIFSAASGSGTISYMLDEEETSLSNGNVSGTLSLTTVPTISSTTGTSAHTITSTTSIATSTTPYSSGCSIGQKCYSSGITFVTQPGATILIKATANTPNIILPVGPSGVVTEVLIANTVYNYVVTFTDGKTVSGSVTSPPAPQTVTVTITE
jgi:hypothetical protein